VSQVWKPKTLVQCDFDGTITEEDVSFLILDAFANGDWRQLLAEHREGRISVGCFNQKAFAMVKASERAMIELTKRKAKTREGFEELVNRCHNNGFRLVIVSNGLDFYIKEILEDVGINDVEVFAARTGFRPEGIQVQYLDPNGNLLDEGFKEAYTKLFLVEGYRIIYVGNGVSDIGPAQLAHHVFACGELLRFCKEGDIPCTPFVDLNDVAEGLETL
jgi:2-hydroxy-3-keto-5-methylthiopentenyl-1-phosphate phosphatase